MKLLIARETAWMLGLRGKCATVDISFDGSLNLRVICTRNQCTAMPSKHSPDKEPLSLQVPRALMGRIKRKARQLDMTVAGYVVAVLTERTRDVTLSSHDYEAIAKATREAEKTGRRCATAFDDPTRS